MKALKDYAKAITHDISDPFERRDAQNEIYASLMDAFDDYYEQFLDETQAIEATIKSFSSDDSLRYELANAHVRKFGFKQIIIFVSLAICILVVLYLLILWFFSAGA